MNRSKLPRPGKRPMLRVYGHDAPYIPPSLEPDIAFREIGGHIYVFRFWSEEKWARTPESSRPGHAQRLGAGWFDMQPRELLEAIRGTFD